MIRFARFHNQLARAKLTLNFVHQRPADILRIIGIERLFVDTLNGIIVQRLYLMNAKESVAYFHLDL